VVSRLAGPLSVAVFQRDSLPMKEICPILVDNCPKCMPDELITRKLDKEIGMLIKRSKSNKFFTAIGDIRYEEFLTNKMAIILLIREGVPYSLFSLIRDQSPFSEADWATILDISTKSLHRYKQTSRLFRPIQSEKIIEMAEVTHAGLDTFGDIDKFKLWLDTPNFALGSLRPLELLKDSYGKEMVLGELTRINHGILA
jgi:putative toxin-antitoxin system antitoxin component (TIGR02293 family)